MNVDNQSGISARKGWFRLPFWERKVLEKKNFMNSNLVHSVMIGDLLKSDVCKATFAVHPTCHANGLDIT